MNWPDITVAIITYKRPKELRLCLAALQKHLEYKGNIHYLIHDDATGGDYLPKLRKEYPHMKFISTDKNSGWGVSANNLYRNIETDIYYFQEEDYILTKPLSLTEGVMLLLTHAGIGLIRYGGVVGHRVVLHMGEVDVNHIDHDYRCGMGLTGKIPYMLIDGSSPEAFVYSNQPHLKHKRFQHFYGNYIEGAKLGETELSYTMNVKDKMKLPNAPAIAVLPEWVVRHFDDIGVSFQHTSEDKGQ